MNERRDNDLESGNSQHYSGLVLHGGIQHLQAPFVTYINTIPACPSAKSEVKADLP